MDGMELLRDQWARRWMFTDESNKGLAIRYIAQLEAENEQAIKLLIDWLKSDDDIDMTIHTDRWLRNKCNCENELPPCKICYALGGE